MQYEMGEWADAVEDGYNRDCEAKARKRQVGETGGKVDWVGRWQAGVSTHTHNTS